MPSCAHGTAEKSIKDCDKICTTGELNTVCRIVRNQYESILGLAVCVKSHLQGCESTNITTRQDDKGACSAYESSAFCIEAYNVKTCLPDCAVPQSHTEDIELSPLRRPSPAAAVCAGLACSSHTRRSHAKLFCTVCTSSCGTPNTTA